MIGKKIISSFLMLSLLLSLCIPKASADTEQKYQGIVYYVDADNGSDDNSGTSESEAWKTLSKVNATTFQPGDAVLLKRGCTWKSSYLYPKGSGTADKPITVSTYGEGDKPIITDNFRKLGERKLSATVYVYNQSYLTIEGLYITNTSRDTGDMFGVRVIADEGYSTVGCIIRDCTIYGSSDESWSDTTKQKMTGIDVSSSTYYGYLRGILIENNEIYNCKARGITVNGLICGSNQNGTTNSQSGRNVVIRGNYLQNIGTDGIFVNNCVEPLIEYNTCDRSHSYSKTGWHVAIWDFACYGATFRHNEAFNTQTTYDATGYDCDYQCYNTLFEYNYSHDNMGGFMLICVEPKNWDGNNSYNVGSVVRYNISQNDLSRTFTLTGAIDKTQIYNNTFYSKSGLANSDYTFFQYSKGASQMSGRKYADSTLIANNIFYVDSNRYFNLSETTNTVFKNNLICGAYSANAPQNDDESETDDGITASGNIYDQDPKFMNAGGAGEGIESCKAYMLYEGSPAIGAGAVIEGSPDEDFFGNRIDASAPNIGAYGGKGVPVSAPTTTATSAETTATTTTAVEPVEINCDINRDGKVNIADLVCIKICLANESYAEEHSLFPDVNLDGKVNIIDLIMTKKLIAKQYT